MSYNGSGTFLINTAGQPVVSGTVISSTAFNALTADLATGLSTAITKDGQTTVTANIPMSTYKFTGLGVGSAATDSANLSQVQSTVTKLLNSVSGADTITATASPTLAAYAAGQMFYFVAAGDNTTSVTLNIDSLGAKAVTRDGSVALAAADIKSGEVIVVVYDGTRFQVVSQLNSAGDARFANVSIASSLYVGGVSTFVGNAGFSANVSIASALSVGGVAAITGATTIGGNLTLSGGTANGVLYLNGSKVATSGANLIYDGTTFTSVGQINVKNDLLLSDATATQGRAYGDASGIVWRAESGLAQRWHIGSNEQMRLNSTGLGIGTASPAVKLDVVGSAASAPISTSVSNTSTTGQYPSASYLIKTYNGSSVATVGAVFGTSSTFGYQQISANQLNICSYRSTGMRFAAASSGPITWGTGANADPDFIEEKMRLDSSGNLGIGTSSPGEKLNVVGGNNTTSTVNFTGGSNNDNATIASDYSLVFQVDANNTVGGRVFNWRYGGNGYEGGTSLMTLNASGNLGIGTASPAQKLDVTGTVNSVQARFGNVAGRGLTIGTSSVSGTNDAGVVFNAPTTEGTLIFQTASTERARITSGGDLYVGCTAAPSATVSGVSIRNPVSSGASTFSSGTTNSATLIAFTNDNGQVGRIDVAGTATSYVTSSDRRLKENIDLADDAGLVVDSIQIVKHDWKSGGHVRYGVIAQDLHKVAPEAVSAGDDGEEIQSTWGVDYSKLVPMLVKELQSVRARLAALESK